MRVQIVCEYFPPRSRPGGVIRSRAGLAATEANSNDVEVVARDRDLDCEELCSPGELARYEVPQRVTVHRVEPGIPAAIRTLRRQGSVDVRVLSGVWSVPYGFVPPVLARTGVLRQKFFIAAPHGESSPSALAAKALKKKPFLALRKALLGADRVVVNASSAHEAQHIREFLPGREPRIVSRQAHCPTPDARAEVPTPHWGGCLVCVGRFAPVKNVELAIRAVAAVPSAQLWQATGVGSVEVRK